jgi:hypothetical protein
VWGLNKNMFGPPKGCKLPSVKVEKEKFDDLLHRMLKQDPEKTSAIKGKAGRPEPIIPPKKVPEPESSEPR